MNYNLKEYKPNTYNKASIRFLHEIAAFPDGIRNEYLHKLLKRRNSAKQKNVRLVKYIYEKIDSGSLDSWDHGEICRKLNISYAMLRYHKSRFLKQLRLLYFDWKRRKQEIENKYAGLSRIELDLIVANEMIKTGMWREGKAMMLKLENNISEDPKIPKKLFYLSEIYENLQSYYIRIQNRNRFLLYHQKMKVLESSILKHRKNYSKAEKSLIRARIYYSISRNINYNHVNNQTYINAIKYLKIALKEAGKCSSKLYSVSLLHEMGNYERLLGNYSSAKEYLKQGLYMAEKYHYKEEALLNSAMLAFISYKYFRIKSEEKNILKYYCEIKKTNPDGWIYNVISIIYYNTTVFSESSNIANAKMEHINYLYRTSAFYAAEMEYYDYSTGTASIAKWKLNEVTKIPFISRINETECRKIENLCLSIISGLYKLNNFRARISILEDRLFFEFLKGKNCSFIKAENIINKISWQLRTRNFNDEHTITKLIKICLDILDSSLTMKKSDLLAKYQKKLEDYLNFTLIKRNSTLLNIYLIVNFTAQLIKIPDIMKISDNYFKKIKNEYPHLFKNFYNEIISNLDDPESKSVVNAA